MKYPCHSFKQYIITMIAMAIIFLFLINGCGTTKTATAASAQLPNYANFVESENSALKNINNFDIHIYTNVNEQSSIVPCYYWTIIDNHKNLY